MGCIVLENVFPDEFGNLTYTYIVYTTDCRQMHTRATPGGELFCVFDTKKLIYIMHVYTYIHTHMYILINMFRRFFLSYSTFSHGATVSISRTAVPKEKN
jgi:hypothetical protein